MTAPAGASSTLLVSPGTMVTDNAWPLFAFQVGFGVVLALTNLVSPTFLPSLSFVMGVVHARGRVGHSVGENAPYAVGAGVAELLMSSLSETRAM